MYGSSPFAQRGTKANSLYTQVGLQGDVQSASPHRLVTLLFDGLFESMSQARMAIETKQIALKGRAITRAVRIVDEGLKSALNIDSGPLASDLRDLYTYVTFRLTRANLHSDIAAIEECERLLRPIRDAWTAIAPADAQKQAA